MASSSNDPFIIAALISRSQQGRLTAAEQDKLNAWIAASDENRQLWMELNNPDVQQQNVRAMARFDETAAVERFLSNKPAKKPKVRFLHTWKWAAAVLVLALGVSTYFLLAHHAKNSGQYSHNSNQRDVPPGRNGAILTLADGTQLVLDSLGEGKIATQGGTQISLNNNQLTYDATAATDGAAALNTITTPKGRQYHITLPDGTEVWLNAASSVQYPVAFKGNERRVKISGEVYFEVASKSWQPFVVETSQMKLEVLGTSFNVNTYNDEKTIRTTLLTGAVKVTPLPGTVHNTHHRVLVPGQTAVLTKPDAPGGSTLAVIETPDADKIIAWKNGLFNFDGMDLFSVMRQLERWYNIEVQYVGKPDNVIFKGKMHRNTNLSDVLKVLETMDVNFELKGNVLYVR